MESESYTINKKQIGKMPTCRYVTQEESENKLNTRDLCEDKMNVGYEIYDNTGNNCSHRNSSKNFKKTLEADSLK